MRLAIYQCTSCDSNFLGREDPIHYLGRRLFGVQDEKVWIPPEHCSRPASRSLAKTERCRSIELSSLPLGQKSVPRGYFGSRAAILDPNLYWERRSIRIPWELNIHLHRCVRADGHNGGHLCTCDYAFDRGFIAGGVVGWSALDAATQLTSITTEQFFDDQPQADPNETVDVEIDVDFVVTPTDDMIVAAYGSIDGGTDFDDTARIEFIIDNGTDPNQAGFQTFGMFQYRVGVRRTGSTDTHTSADMNHRQGSMS